MNKQAAIREYDEFYNDECTTLMSQYLRKEMNKRGADIRTAKAEWAKYLSMRSESIEYLRSIGEWKHSSPTDATRVMPDDEF